MGQSYEQERHVALSAVAAACRLSRQLQRELSKGGIQSKQDASPVTVADYAVQAVVVSRIRRAFPDDWFIVEESAGPLREDGQLRRLVAEAANMDEQEVVVAIDACGFEGGTAERTWILDPIDGTRGFVAGRQFCVALGLLHGGLVRLGVLGCPRLPLAGMLAPPDAESGCLFHATRGSGTYMLPDSDVHINVDADIGVDAGIDTPLPVLGERVRVADVADPLWATFCESVETGHSSHELSARVASILGVSAPPVRMDSQAKYGCMARGDAAIFLRFPRRGYIENVWDCAPAAIVLEEAGGAVTDGRGRPLNFTLGRKMDNDDGIVATNGSLHHAVIHAVQQAIRESKTP